MILKTDFLPVCYVNESLDNTLLTLKLWTFSKKKTLKLW